MVELKPGPWKWSLQCNVTNSSQRIRHSARSLFICIVLSIIPSLGFADNLLDVFQLAIQNDSELKAAQAAKQALLTNEQQARADFFPRLSAFGTAGKVAQNLKDAEGAVTYNALGGVESSILGNNVYNSFSAFLQVVQPLYDVKIYRRHKAAEIDTIKAELEYRIAQQSLIFRVAEAYFNLLRAGDELTFARAEKNAITQQLEQTKHRFKLGLTAVTDVHEAQARHDLALAQEIKAEIEQANNEEVLRRITGKIHKNLMRLKPDVPLVPPSPSNIEDWTDAASKQNFEVADAKYDADKIKLQIDIEHGDRFPTIDLKAKYGYNKWGGPYRQESTDAIVSLDFYMSLFEGNKIKYKVNRLEHRYDEAIYNVDLKEKEITQKTRQAYLGVLAGAVQ